MKNPWLDIPLDDYESHMALPGEGQSQLLSQLLGEAVEKFKPFSVALLGCAGGNGLERILATSVERIVGIDINQSYLERTGARFRDRIPCLELFAGDLEVDRFVFDPVDLVFAGLIFEYVDTTKLLEQARSMLNMGGRLISGVQLSSPIADVTPSPYTTLNKVASVLRIVPCHRFVELATVAGFDAEEEDVVIATGGKKFQVNTFRASKSSNSFKPTPLPGAA